MKLRPFGKRALTQVLLEGSNESETLQEEAIVTEILREEGIDTGTTEALQEEFTYNEAFLEGPIETETLREDDIFTEVQY